MGGVLLLGINLYPLPFTSGDVGIPYVYPFVIATWFVGVYLRMLASRGWAHHLSPLSRFRSGLGHRPV